MSSQRLRDMLRAKPFQPFELGLADGQRIRVEHPDFAFPSPGGRTLIVFDKRKPGEDDEHFRIIDVLLVTTLEPVNGNRKRKARRGK